jgi:hypothetical protein
LSGYYVARVSVQDNVNNAVAETARAGFFYDSTLPVTGNRAEVYDVNGNATGFTKTSGAHVGTTFVNTDKVLFRTVAHDRPAKDPNGSGLASAYIRYIDNNNGTSGALTPTAVSSVGEHASTDPATRYIWTVTGRTARQALRPFRRTDLP